MTDDEAIKLPVTETWWQRFHDAIEALPQGEKQKCADFAGCSSSLISRLLARQVDSSEHLGKISEYLKIPPPVVRVETPAQVRLSVAMQGLSEEDIDLLTANANRLKR